jgi:hypothetical protein
VLPDASAEVAAVYVERFERDTVVNEVDVDDGRNLHVPTPGVAGFRIEGLLEKPSDGLEPSTPSLPWRCSTN